MKNKFFLVFLPALMLPMLALAQSLPASGLGDVIHGLGTILDATLGLIVAVALVFFFWGLAKYILSGGDEDARTAGRNMMIYGVIALFVMVSVWGLVNVLGGTFNLSESPPPLPGIPS